METMQTETTYEVKEVKEPGCITRFFNRRIVRLVLFLSTIGYDVFCVVFDWLWVNDALTVEKGLVFGPPSRGMTIALIVVAISGTVSFIAEMYFTIQAECYDNDTLDDNSVQLLTLFFEEIPAVTLNVIMAACREVPMSYYQLVKAALAVIGSVHRCIRTIAKYSVMRMSKKLQKGCMPFVLRVLVLAALVYTCSGGLTVWIFTYGKLPDHDHEGLKLPDYIYSKHSDKYLYKSGVYLSHPSFAHCNNNTRDWELTRSNWLKLESVFDVMDAESTDAVFYYNDVENLLRVTIVFQPELNKDNIDICYHTTLSDCHVSKIRPEEIHELCQINYGDILEFKFLHTPPSKVSIFGNVKFRGTLTYENATCDFVESDDWGFLTVPSSNVTIGQMQYFKAHNDVDDAYSFLEDEASGKLDYFVSGRDMYNVSEVWKTGYTKCKMTGSYSPVPTEDIDMKCY